jgi:hypothetical protein
MEVNYSSFKANVVLVLGKIKCLRSDLLKLQNDAMKFTCKYSKAI